MLEAASFNAILLQLLNLYVILTLCRMTERGGIVPVWLISKPALASAGLNSFMGHVSRSLFGKVAAIYLMMMTTSDAKKGSCRTPFNYVLKSIIIDDCTARQRLENHYDFFI